jgi:hypothetical protein
VYADFLKIRENVPWYHGSVSLIAKKRTKRQRGLLGVPLIERARWRKRELVGDKDLEIAGPMVCEDQKLVTTRSN